MQDARLPPLLLDTVSPVPAPVAALTPAQEAEKKPWELDPEDDNFAHRWEIWEPWTPGGAGACFTEEEYNRRFAEYLALQRLARKRAREGRLEMENPYPLATLSKELLRKAKPHQLLLLHLQGDLYWYWWRRMEQEEHRNPAKKRTREEREKRALRKSYEDWIKAYPFKLEDDPPEHFETWRNAVLRERQG
tara:strand:- start:538 stop:1110 length:573 start_codon:yes stop_codon:yes gene_type:complete